MTSTKTLCAVVVGILVAVAAQAADLPKLPGELTLVQGKDSPGPVAFRHDSHVDADKAAGSCTGCHPANFRILGKSGAAPAEPITHDRMKAGLSCGKCHGKGAFDFEDCSNCHKM